MYPIEPRFLANGTPRSSPGALEPFADTEPAPPPTRSRTLTARMSSTHLLKTSRPQGLTRPADLRKDRAMSHEPLHPPVQPSTLICTLLLEAGEDCQPSGICLLTATLAVSNVGWCPAAAQGEEGVWSGRARTFEFHLIAQFLLTSSLQRQERPGNSVDALSNSLGTIVCSMVIKRFLRYIMMHSLKYIALYILYIK